VTDKKGVELTPIRRIRLYEEVENQLMSLVTNGVLKPGDKFPSESVLIKQLNVSRAVLREAFRILEAKGLVYSIQGGGRYLRPIDKSNSINSEYLALQLEKTSIIEIYEVRLGLEPIAAKLAAIHCKPEDIENMENIVAKLEKKNHNTEHDYPFHMAIAKAGGNYVLGKLISLQLNLVYGVSNEKVNNIINQRKMEDYIIEHKEILEAIKKKDSEKSAHLMEEHLKKSLNLLMNDKNSL
jgi:GntR family transcriptional repressor for pyruvate dehydrogenase complex